MEWWKKFVSHQWKLRKPRCSMRGSAELAKKMFQFPMVAVEIGVALATNAIDMLQHLSLKRLYLVDPYSPYNYGTPQEATDKRENYKSAFLYLFPWQSKTTLITQESVFASELFDNEFFDYVYIDGNHTAEAVQADILAWFPKVKKGGILGGHDYNTEHCGVTWAVDNFQKISGLELLILSDTDWAVIKK